MGQGRCQTINDYRIITAPVLIPGVPDCDYTNGETPLTTEQIATLMESYKEHKIVDYNHKYMFDGEWYKRNLGTPINIWQSDKEITYTDRFGVTRTTPPGTWWQTTKITDPEAIQLIDDEKLNAHSLTTVNKQFLDKFLQISNSNISTKDNKSVADLLKEYDISLKHRTPISKLKEPVAFTVSLTGFPCVGGAVFARDCLVKSQNRISTKNQQEEDDKMTEETKNTGGWSLNDVKELFGLFTSMKSEEKEEKQEQEPEEKPEKQEYVTKEELNATLEENNKKLINDIKEIIDEKIGKEDEPEGKGEGADKTEEKPDKTEGNVSNKNAEDILEPEGEQMPEEIIEPQSQQLDDPDPQEGEYSHKKGTPEYRILQKLGRDALGNSKIRL